MQIGMSEGSPTAYYPLVCVELSWLQTGSHLPGCARHIVLVTGGEICKHYCNIYCLNSKYMYMKEDLYRELLPYQLHVHQFWETQKRYRTNKFYPVDIASFPGAREGEVRLGYTVCACALISKNPLRLTNGYLRFSAAVPTPSSIVGCPLRLAQTWPPSCFSIEPLV